MMKFVLFQSLLVASVLRSNAAKDYELRFFAVGDWGADPVSTGPLDVDDRRDQASVAHNMNVNAQQWKSNSGAISAIIGHGDSFYQNGVQSMLGNDKVQMDKTFKQVYLDNSPDLNGINWVNAFGNHDVGVYEQHCFDSNNQRTICPDAISETVAMQKYVTAQNDYGHSLSTAASARYNFGTHDVVNNVGLPYSHESFTSVDSSASVEIITVDGNLCQVEQICNATIRGSNAGQDKACAALLKKWFDDSITLMKDKLSKSTADWVIVNSHYNPWRHFINNPDALSQWMDPILQHQALHHNIIVLCGHAHYFAHDVFTDTANGNEELHVFMNGFGGGHGFEKAANDIKSYYKDSMGNHKGPIANVKALDAVALNKINSFGGFLSLAATKDSLRVKVFLDTNSNSPAYCVQLVRQGGSKFVDCTTRRLMLR